MPLPAVRESGPAHRPTRTQISLIHQSRTRAHSPGTIPPARARLRRETRTPGRLLGPASHEPSRGPIWASFFACLFAVRHCKATARSSVGPPVLLAPAHPFSKPFTLFECFTLSPTRLTLRDALLQLPLAPARARYHPGLARQLRPPGPLHQVTTLTSSPTGSSHGPVSRICLIPAPHTDRSGRICLPRPAP